MSCRSWMRRNWRWLGLAVLLLSVCAIPEAAARAGGGGSFRSSGGGGRSSGGSFGSGGSGFGSSGRGFTGGNGSGLSAGGAIACLVVAGIAIALFSRADITAHIQGLTIRRGHGLASQQSREDSINQILATDPEFSEDSFRRRTSRAFLHLQAAWSKQDLAPVRHFMSDAVHERFSLQLADRQQRGVRNIMEDVSVQENAIAQVDVSTHFQTITVRIQASAVDYEEDEAGWGAPGLRLPESFVEYWSFVRRPGAKTKSGGGLLEGNCPNCGASLQMNQAAQCESCKTKVLSGQYDWVLSEITQESEWQLNEHREVRGFAAMAAADPAFSLQHLEDRGSVMFWRRIAAMLSGSTDPLRKMARETYCKALELELRPDGKGRRLVPTEAAVGSVETVGIFCAEPVDQALLEVHWSSGQERLMPDGSRRPRAMTSFHRSFFILSRNHGVTGNADEALASAHCPDCGSPAMDTAANACEYCGLVLNQGDRDWVLDGVYSSNDRPVVDLLARQEQETTTEQSPAPPQLPIVDTPADGSELVAWVVHVMLADGEIDAKERNVLSAFASKHGVPEARVQQFVVAMEAGELEVGLPANRTTALRWLEAMAEMALADGFIAKEEKATMLALGKRLDLTKNEVNQIISRTRSRLYKEERERLRKVPHQG